MKKKNNFNFTLNRTNITKKNLITTTYFLYRSIYYYHCIGTSCIVQLFYDNRVGMDESGAAADNCELMTKVF